MAAEIQYPNFKAVSRRSVIQLSVGSGVLSARVFTLYGGITTTLADGIARSVSSRPILINFYDISDGGESHSAFFKLWTYA